MRTVGIIAECNPFHEGHAYLLREARRITGADHIVVAMSGDFVQRGAPAILDKRTRARAILENGADLVLELPLCISCGSAGWFAAGATRLLQSLGVVTDLCFGSESGDTAALLTAAKQMEDPAYDQAVGQLLREGMSYPSAMAQAAAGAAGAVGASGTFDSVGAPDTAGGVSPVAASADAASGSVLSGNAPNDLLAVAYCRELLRTDSSIAPHAILRCETEGATVIRSRLLAERAAGVPSPLLSEQDLSDMLLHAIMFAPVPLTDYQDVSGDLANRILAMLPSYRDLDSFCALLKNRSLTYTRIRRALLHILLDIRSDDVRRYAAAGYIGYIRPLGFRREAAPLLRAISEHASVPYLARLSADRKRLAPPFDAMLEADLRASDLCALLRQRATGSDAPAVPELSRQLIIL